MGLINPITPASIGAVPIGRVNGSSIFNSAFGSARYNATTGIDGIRFAASGSNIDYTYNLWGIGS